MKNTTITAQLADTTCAEKRAIINLYNEGVLAVLIEKPIFDNVKDEWGLA